MWRGVAAGRTDVEVQGMQGSTNQMIPPLPQSHMMGMNPMHSGPVHNNNVPPTMGNFANGIANTQGLSTQQTYQLGGVFNRTQTGQFGPAPGLNAFQTGNPAMDVRGTSMGMGPNMGPLSGLPPPPPGPPPLPHGSAPK